MRLSVFTKLFLVYTILTLVPLIVAVALTMLGYEKAIDNFFVGQPWEESPTMAKELFLILAELKLRMIIVIVAMTLLSLLGSFLIAQNLIFPIKKIITGIKEVGSGNLDFKIEAKSNDELGESAKHFNEMINRLKKAKLAMEEARDTLEIKVSSKTKELEELVKNMDSTIKNKTKELRDRIDELERVHRLSVGRELKMIELKKEIQELQAKLKNKKT